MKTDDKQKTTRGQNFVSHVLGRAQSDTAYAAKLRRGDNPDTEDAAYEIVARFANLLNDYERQPFLLIGAALCRNKPAADGTDSLGRVLARHFKAGTGKFNDMDKNDQGDLRMRRILACSDTREICQVLRPVLSLLKDDKNLSYGRLLDDLLFFESQWQQRIKLRWARDFYAGKEREPATGKERQSEIAKKEKQSGSGKKSAKNAAGAAQTTELNGFGE